MAIFKKMIIHEKAGIPYTKEAVGQESKIITFTSEASSCSTRAAIHQKVPSSTVLPQNPSKVGPPKPKSIIFLKMAIFENNYFLWEWCLCHMNQGCWPITYHRKIKMAIFKNPSPIRKSRNATAMNYRKKNGHF